MRARCWRLAQAAAVLAPGARRIAATASPAQPECASSPLCGLEYAAFRDPGGEQVVVVTNSGARPLTFAIRRPNGQSFSYALPGQSRPDGTDNSRGASVVTFGWGPGVT